jgi:hypothetical protein
MSPDDEYLQRIVNQLNLRVIRSDRPTWRREGRKESTPDFCIAPKDIVVEVEITDFNFMSDHRPLSLRIAFQNEKRHEITRYIPNKKVAANLAKLSADSWQGTDPKKWLFYVEENITTNYRRIWSAKKAKFLRKRKEGKSKAAELNEQEFQAFMKEYWNDKWAEINFQFTSNETASAWKQIRMISKFDVRTKRDGAIVNTIKINGKTENDEEIVAESIIQTIKDIQGDQGSVPDSDARLGPMDEKELKDLLKRMSTNKGLSYDGFSDHVFKNITPDVFEAMRNLWTIPLKEINSQHFDCRLVPLNKVHPAIPEPKAFNPIVIMSP